MDKIFASVDCLDFLSFIDLSQVDDFEVVRDIPPVYPGPFAGMRAGHYRMIDPVFLGWIDQRVSAAVRNYALDSEWVGRAVKFFQDVRDASGIEPARADEIPADYCKPGLTR